MTTSLAKSSLIATRHQFAKASFVLDDLGRYESTKMINTKTLNNSKAILKQCIKTSSTKSSLIATRHKFVDASFVQIFIFDLERDERTQVINIKMLNNSKESAIQCAITLSIDCNSICTRHKVIEANSSLVIIN